MSVQTYEPEGEAKARLLVTCPPFLQTLDDYLEELLGHGLEVVAPEVDQEVPEDALVGVVEGVEAVVAGDDPYTDRVAGAATELAILVKWGVGIDAVDVEAFERRGVRVEHTPDVFGDEVADVALGYLVLLARRLHEIDRGVRDGGWPKPQGTSLRGERLGIVGAGDIGSSLARRGSVLGMDLVGHDIRTINAGLREETGLEPVPLDDLLETARFVVLCCGLTEQNRHMIDEAALSRMRSDAHLVNVGRGPLVDTRALARALEAGELAGAALEVFEEEPLPSAHPLRSAGNCIFGSHNASNTRQAVHRVNRQVIDLVYEGLDLEGTP